MKRADYRCLDCGVVEELVQERGDLPVGQVCRSCGGFMRRKYGSVGIGRVDGAGGSPSR